MEYLIMFGGILFIGAGIYFLIIPTIRCAREIRMNDVQGEVTRITGVEIIAFIFMPVFGYFSLFLFKSEAELLDWKYITVIWVLSGLTIFAYFISRSKKHDIGPLALALLPGLLMTGIVLSIVLVVHFSPFFALGAAFSFSPFFILTIFVLPFFGLIQVVVLLSVELFSILQLNKNRMLSHKSKSSFIQALQRIFFGKYYLVAQIILFPLFITLVQVVFLVFTQHPDSIVQAIIQSHDGVFSQGHCENCVSHNAEYVCTIAAFGSDRLVKPLHWGRRNGNEIKVNRQLKICNAFEELLTEKMPRTQRLLRKGYDSLQISIEKWKKVRIVANTLYVIIKPMEWTFLIMLYLFENNPETKIAKQYLPIEIMD